MKTLLILTKRNSKLFFKDKGMFFSSLITPAILLVLYVTFLSNVYRDSFLSALPEGFSLSDSIIDGVVGGQLASSLLAVCCVTIAFCSNLLMIQDKVTGSVRDLTVTPVKRSVLAMGYFASSALVTLIVCLVTCGICFAYLAAIGGWFLSGGDIALILLDVFLLTLFGTALSSCLHYFLTTQGQLSAVGTLVSAGYGFVCGAYMPMSNFPVGLQKALSFLPGHLRHEPAAQPLDARRARRNGQQRRALAGDLRDTRRHRLQHLFFRQGRLRACNVSDRCRVCACRNCNLHPHKRTVPPKIRRQMTSKK